MSNKSNRHVLSPTAKESMVYPFGEKEYRRGIATLKNNKAAGIDDVLVEQLKNLGAKTQQLLHSEQDLNNLEENDDDRHIKSRERLRHLKVTGQYPFCATRTNYRDD